MGGEVSGSVWRVVLFLSFINLYKDQVDCISLDFGLSVSLTASLSKSPYLHTHTGPDTLTTSQFMMSAETISSIQISVLSYRNMTVTVTVVISVVGELRIPRSNRKLKQ